MKHTIISLTVLFFLFNSCDAFSQNIKIKKTTKPNVILLIGDGMGLSQLSSVFYYGDKTPAVSKFTEIGLINTSSATDIVTDSGAGGTAFSCGIKTYNNTIGMNTDTLKVKNITELLSEKKYNTGVISTSAITHATPACFYAHVKSRKMENEIAQQLVSSDIDFFAGGGMQFFSNRVDSVDVLKALSDNGFIINNDKNKPLNQEKKYGFLLAEKAMPEMTNGRGDFLPEYTKLALEYFAEKGKNFFLMVEGSQIDWAGHKNNAEYLIAEMLDFDKAVGVALDFAEKDKNTLVIVLADHETGGFTLAADGKDYNTIKPSFASKEHSTSLIPVLAFGPGSEKFSGIYQNIDIFHKILELTK